MSQRPAASATQTFHVASRRAGDHRAPTVHAAPSSAGTRRTQARSARFESAAFC